MSYLYDPVDPVVQTKYGKVRGYTYGGVDHFFGVKYAKARRFHMPEEPDSWDGVRDTRRFGPVMLQMRPFNPEERNMGLNMPWQMSEDCQNLNIWAPSGGAGSKRPVFVWMHGGGCFSGHATENIIMDGFNMAHDGGVVFVSINHRLNLLGHLNLADYGEEFGNAKNVGIADLVAALRWIHENIEAFGGDPDNVTICGHSGGGGKVLCMYQIEEAKDLFSRGIVMSGVLDNGPETNEADSRKLAGAMLDSLGIGKDNIERIYDVSFDQLVAAYRSVARGLKEEGVNIGLAPLANSYFRGFPIDVGFCGWSKDKPLMLSTVLGEFNFKVRVDESFKITATEEEKEQMLHDRFGARSAELAELFRKAYPGHDLIDLMYLDADFRRPTYETAKLHAAASAEENTYVYLFAFNMPTQHRITPWHGVDIALAFSNAEKSPVCNEPVYGPRNAGALGNAYLNFTRCGDPGNAFLPEWRPFTDGQRYTMVIDRECELKEAYDEELIALYKQICPPLNFSPEL